jgi:hypothetical protein
VEPGALAPLLVVSAAVFAPTTAWMGRRRHRSAVIWSVFGVTLGPLGLLLAWVSPPARCVACGTPTVGWLHTCEECGANVRTGLVDEGDLVPARAPVDDREATRAPARSARGARAGAADPRLRREMARPISGQAGVERAGAQPVGSLGTASNDGQVVPAPAGASGASVVVAAVAQPSAVEPEPAPRARARAPRTTNPGAKGGPVALATGVYAGGSIGLEIGHRYTIARDEQQLMILGPVETTPTEIAHRRALTRIDPVGVDDRLVITGTEDERGRYLIRFQAVAGMATEEVERRLTAPAEVTRVKRPAAARRAPSDG